MNTGATMPLEWVPSGQDAAQIYPAYSATSARGAPKGLRETKTLFYVYPVADAENSIGDDSAAGEYQISIPYRKKEIVLVAGAFEDSNAFTNDPSFQCYL